MRDLLRAQTCRHFVSPDTVTALFPQADSPASAQDLLSRIKQEEHPCVWDQQDLAERDIPTDPNSGEQVTRMNVKDKDPYWVV